MTAASYALSGLVNWPITGLLIAGGIAGTMAGIAIGATLLGQKRVLELGLAGVVVRLAAT